MTLRDDYKRVGDADETKIIIDEEGKEIEAIIVKKVISDDAFVVCDFIEKLINKIERVGRNLI